MQYLRNRFDGWYRWLRYSPRYLWYARVFRRSFVQTMAAEEYFFRSLFAEHGIRRVFDVGANVGDMAEVFRHLADQVVCVEADPDTARVLVDRFRRCPAIAVETTALGDSVGQVELRRKKFCGFNTLSEKWAAALDSQALPTTEIVRVPVTTLDRVIAKHGSPDYLKIDVEGHELPVVRGLTEIVPVVSFEANLPIFRPETEQIVQRFLERDPSATFNARKGGSRGWMLPAPADAECLRRLLDVSGTTTYDIFAFSSRRR